MGDRSQRIQPHNVPPELTVTERWLAWNRVTRNGKTTKVPKDAKTGKAGSPTDPKTWSSFSTALDFYNKGKADGLGIALQKNGKPTLTAIDIDHCIDENGNVSDKAKEIIEAVSSYSEISPSGHGIRILVNSDSLPEGYRKKNGIEMYDDARFVTVTGNHIEGTPEWIAYNPDEVVKVWRKYLGPKDEPQATTVGTEEPGLTDDDILRRASSAKNADKFKSLWEGEITGYSSQSEADLALCDILAFYSQNYEQIDRLFRRSKLYRNKWDSRRGKSTYGRETIAQALSLNTVNNNICFYPPYTGSVRNGKEVQNSGIDNDIDKLDTSCETSSLHLPYNNLTNPYNPYEPFQSYNNESDGMTGMLRGWVQLASGVFSVQDVFNELALRTPEQKNAVYVAAHRLCKAGLIEPTGKRRGEYRRIEAGIEEQDWRNVTNDALKVDFPLGVAALAKVKRGNIILLEGQKSQGKTTFALEFCRLNRNLFPGQRIRYQNVEMSDEEIRDRLSAYPQETITLDEWGRKVQFIRRTDNWWDIINPDGLNVIDYLVEYEKAYLIAQFILNIHKKLKDGIALVITQRDPMKPYGAGGYNIRNIPRVILSIINHTIKIEDIKSWQDDIQNPNGLQRKYKLVDWWKFKPQEDWHREENDKHVGKSYAKS